MQNIYQIYIVPEYLHLTRGHYHYAKSWRYRIYIRHVSNAEVRLTTGCSPLSYLVTVTRRIAALQPHCSQFTSRGSPPSPRSGYPTSTARLEATNRKTYPHLAPCGPWPSKLRPRDCPEKGHYLRWMATYCWHGNAPFEYTLWNKEITCSVCSTTFLPRDVMHSADYAIARCPSVCLSVRPSVCHAPVLCRNC